MPNLTERKQLLEENHEIHSGVERSKKDGKNEIKLFKPHTLNRMRESNKTNLLDDLTNQLNKSDSLHDISMMQSCQTINQNNSQSTNPTTTWFTLNSNAQIL